jgi:hypothetical protein
MVASHQFCQIPKLIIAIVRKLTVRAAAKAAATGAAAKARRRRRAA